MLRVAAEKQRAGFVIELQAHQVFVRRYLSHVVPRGFMGVRHYGFLANRVRRDRLKRIRTLLPPRTTRAKAISVPALRHQRCPQCQIGFLHRTLNIEAPATVDTS